MSPSWPLFLRHNPDLYPSRQEALLNIMVRDQFRFPSGDPLSGYVTQNMTFITDFKLQDRIIVRCFIDNASALDILKKEYEQDSTDPELNTQLGIIYEKRGDLNQAALYYKKAIAKNPKFIQALNQLAAVYKKQGNSEASLYYETLIKKLDDAQGMH